MKLCGILQISLVSPLSYFIIGGLEILAYYIKFIDNTEKLTEWETSNFKLKTSILL